MTIDSSKWTGRPSMLVRDDLGVSEADWAAMACEDRREWWRMRIMALIALWSPPRESECKSQYVNLERARGDDWTFWRGIRATLAIVTGRDYMQRQVDRHGYQSSFDVAFFDARSLYGGYTGCSVWLYPRLRVSIFHDGETFL